MTKAKTEKNLRNILHVIGKTEQIKQEMKKTLDNLSLNTNNSKTNIVIKIAQRIDQFSIEYIQVANR